MPSRETNKQRYLLYEQSNNFLNLADAHLNAALTCTTYLAYTSLDVLMFPEPEKTATIKS